MGNVRPRYDTRGKAAPETSGEAACTAGRTADSCLGHVAKNVKPGSSSFCLQIKQLSTLP